MMIMTLLVGSLLGVALYLAKRLTSVNAELAALRNKNASLKRQLRRA